MTQTPPTPRVVRTATIMFGLVAIPVKLYTSAETADEISFNNLHDKDGARLKQQYVCTLCNEVVDRDHMVKGYEHAKGQYVTFTQDELDALDAVATNEVRVEEFLALSAVDPLYVAKTYYVGPDKGSERSFSLFVDALVDTKRVAIASYARAGEERVVMVRPLYDELLALHELRYAHEVKSTAGIPVDPTSLKPAEKKLARQIIDHMTSDTFEPERYQDSVLARRRALIQQKIDGGEITVSPPAPIAAADLMDAMKASLDVAKPGTKRVRVPPPRRDRKARAASYARKAPTGKKRKAG